jgi:hypothetical protein
VPVNGCSAFLVVSWEPAKERIRTARHTSAIAASVRRPTRLMLFMECAATGILCGLRPSLPSEKVRPHDEQEKTAVQGFKNGKLTATISSGSQHWVQ